MDTPEARNRIVIWTDGSVSAVRCRRRGPQPSSTALAPVIGRARGAGHPCSNKAPPVHSSVTHGRRCVTSHRLRWLAPHSPRAPGGPRLSRSRYRARVHPRHRFLRVHCKPFSFKLLGRPFFGCQQNRSADPRRSLTLSLDLVVSATARRSFSGSVLVRNLARLNQSRGASSVTCKTARAGIVISPHPWRFSTAALSVVTWGTITMQRSSRCTSQPTDRQARGGRSVSLKVRPRRSAQPDTDFAALDARGLRRIRAALLAIGRGVVCVDGRLDTEYRCSYRRAAGATNTACRGRRAAREEADEETPTEGPMSSVYTDRNNGGATAGRVHRLGQDGARRTAAVRGRSAGLAQPVARGQSAQKSYTQCRSVGFSVNRVPQEEHWIGSLLRVSGRSCGGSG